METRSKDFSYGTLSGHTPDYDIFSLLPSSPISPSKSVTFRTPASCCTENSTYQNNACASYYEHGCTIYVREIITETILIIGTVALVIGAVQV